ncbi:mitochondrial carrier [Neurospora crassa]|uniref:Peroxisomal adenine nucleotide transporter 1 n=1 Tax=Neurospora crassa (strain ATCC 24698 / 74-OR23-1A / CBS 708.71 / DSM 1257 / FGSC 987) TaxID=367110 RepID=Q7S114_NEUCR|nr:peroxisomal adenine nucleotide transporter 1 [Neurospora crassa OR74A]EAA29036.1 peroxisomal adenine nucleotide transporter 1 [Neurospora crassa OR74A]KHE78738.1 mitochondrial carrier [Neurospora crassa]|eukprot:XP_958272.1 peroxisomal adenine nucleotide transporter 1 [Neurospora crassa OR74A]
MPRASKLLPSLGHAASGAGGTIISTLTTYPLDLVNTRLKVQRQLRADGAIGPEDGYQGVWDAFQAIYEREGGLKAFFAGLGPDLGKSAADSFLFFLFYTWFRAKRLRVNEPYLKVLEELAVGAAAGACAKLFTTPVSNVVTRRQTANLISSSSSSSSSSPSSSSALSRSSNPSTPPTDGGGSTVRRRRPSSPRAAAATAAQPDLSFTETIVSIYRERGLLNGLWAGYSASLVLTLNPSMTFFLQQILKRMLVSRENWEEPGSAITFVIAALSKVMATSVTYPFQIAKARVQVSAAPSSSASASASAPRDDTSKKEVKKEGKKAAATTGRRRRETIFSTVRRIAETEGVKALYDGIGGELLKAFFNHGLTMLSKDIIHGLIIQLYFAVVAALKDYKKIRESVSKRAKKARGDMSRYYMLATLAAQMLRQRGLRQTLAMTGVLGKGKVE